MPRRKQDCPKRMKWEEEALLASARAAAAAAVVDGDSRDLPQADASPRSADEAEVDQELPETSPVASLSNQDSAQNSPQDTRRPPSSNDSEETSGVCASPDGREHNLSGQERLSASPGRSPSPSSPRANLLPKMALLSASSHPTLGAEQLRAFLAAGVGLPGLLSSPEGAAAAELLGLSPGLPLGFPTLPGLPPFTNPLLNAMKLPTGLHGPPSPNANRPPSTSSARSPLMSPTVASLPPGPTVSTRNTEEFVHSPVLDFSTKRPASEARNGVVHGGETTSPKEGLRTESPLDLSFTRKRDRPHELNSAASPVERKSSRLEPPKSVDVPLWNGLLVKGGKTPLAPPPPPPPQGVSDATRALERMTELTRLTGERSSSLNSLNHSLAAPTPPAPAPVAALSGRQSAWQSHWLSKGAEAARDVLKCVWCKQSFDSLAAMTTHMKESKHCGVNASLINSTAVASAISPSSGSSSHSQSLTTPTSSPSHPYHHQSQPPTHHRSNSHHLPPSSSSPSTSSHPAATSSSTTSELLKDTVPMPRKLVRGQDVWLGKGAEQTRQILKCMWCGQSFRSLAEMTTHMQQTQHYTNIISQEQIISWKAADDKTAQNHVNAVLTCKVCDQAFASLKELSSHMVKNSHYKEHIMRSLSESGGRRRQARDKRKKALPVRKLLELERAQQEARRDSHNSTSGSGGRITCEKCGDKIETAIFVDHIRACVGSAGSKATSHHGLTKPSNKEPSAQNRRTSSSPSAPVRTPDALPHPKALRSSAASPKARPDQSPSAPVVSVAPTENNNIFTAGDTSSGSSPSVLNAIEKLIEKSFDTPGKKATNNLGPGSNILRRLGIDENVDYTKPLMDPMTVNMLRLYGYQPRERSASEASSASDRGGPGDFSHHSYNGHALTSEPLGLRDTETPNSLPPTKDRDSGLKDGESDSRSERLSPSAVSDHSDNFRPSNVKAEPFEDDIPSLVQHKTQNAASPCPSTVSERSMRSATPASLYDRKVNSSPDDSKYSASRRTSTDLKPDDHVVVSANGSGGASEHNSSLSALSSMFEGLAAPASGSSVGANPLAALQKLCDKTDSAHAARPSPSASLGSQGTGATVSGAGGATATNPGAILAFSWACNDAVMTDSVMKCAFCDTQFISKGAYRHHLSKMHFVKDPAILQPTLGAKSAAGTKSNSQSPQPVTTPNSSGGGGASGANFEESPHSKFLKYTELAKQLSSKYV